MFSIYTIIEIKMLEVMPMNNLSIPVILLKQVALLPHNELRLEFDNKDSKKIIDEALLSYDNKVFVVTKLDYLEESTLIEDLPLIGVVANIKSRMELPNGKTRVVLSGLNRALVSSYIKNNNMIMSSIKIMNGRSNEEDKNGAILKKLKKEVERYIKVVPYISNGVISQIEDLKSLDLVTDIIVDCLQISLDRKIEYIGCLDATKRAKMILEDIYKDEESFEIEQKLDILVKEELDKNQKEYILKEKLQLIKAELGDVSLKDSEIFELRKRIAMLEAPKKVKERLEYELNRYQALPNSSSELGMIRDYIECLLSLPWNKKTLDNDDLASIKESLDESHYGLNDVKDRIIEYLAVRKVSDKIKSPIICLVGPPGVGKTTLAKSIAHALNRRFSKISVGGLSDEAEIRGHRRTYVGSYPGRIIESLKSTKTSNPLILIDEIDKIEKGPHGDPASALLEVLDKTQNNSFHDIYVDLDYDISDVMFVLTANDIDDIPAPLLDRLEVIKLAEYTDYEKCDIVKKHLIPRLCHDYNLDTITISDDVIMSIIHNYTKEAGVRELERALTTIVRKIVTKRVIENISDKSIELDAKDIDSYLGRIKFKSMISGYNQSGVVSALSYTPYGGEVMPIEVNYYKGKGNLILTGSLGKIMQESAAIALSYIKSTCKYFKIDYNDLVDNDIHIHLPSGAISKDGPSAGVTLATSIISAFNDIYFDNSISMTGELTLRGRILPVGGIREKCLGAIKNGIKKIFIPLGNKDDVENLSKEIKGKLEFIYVDDYKEIYDYLMKEMK